VYVPEGPELDERAVQFGQGIRNIVHEGTQKEKRSVYVNYAFGDEELTELYGEQWRLNRLKGLKEKYDPHGRFNFYGPIA
jgi:FAD/FMN-containing dehydrogenase